MFEALEQKIQTYNHENEQEGRGAHVQVYVSEHDRVHSFQTAVAVCTPIMVHEHQMLRQSGELVYVDATSTLDRYDCPTFIMISTCTPAGGFPLGVVITSGEDETTITEALNWLKSQNAFNGGGPQGPAMCIIDDCAAEQAAVHSTCMVQD